jgi:hypothetical protein
MGDLKRCCVLVCYVGHSVFLFLNCLANEYLDFIPETRRVVFIHAFIITGTTTLLVDY